MLAKATAIGGNGSDSGNFIANPSFTDAAGGDAFREKGEEEWRRLLTTDFRGQASLTLASFGVAQA